MAVSLKSFSGRPATKSTGFEKDLLSECEATLGAATRLLELRPGLKSTLQKLTLQAAEQLAAVRAAGAALNEAERMAGAASVGNDGKAADALNREAAGHAKERATASEKMHATKAKLGHYAGLSEACDKLADAAGMLRIFTERVAGRWSDPNPPGQPQGRIEIAYPIGSPGYCKAMADKLEKVSA